MYIIIIRYFFLILRRRCRSVRVQYNIITMHNYIEVHYIRVQNRYVIDRFFSFLKCFYYYFVLHRHIVQTHTLWSGNLDDRGT